MLLERRGARVIQAPAIRIVPLDDDAELLAATRACVERPPDIAVATTGIGFRGWMEAADDWSPASESSAEVLEYLLGQDLSNRRIAVQLHGEPLPDFTDALQTAGAEVVPVPVYRWVLPEDVTPLGRLVDAVAAHQVDCVVFTSAPAVASLLTLASETGLAAEVEAAFRGGVVPACVGPVTAARLERVGIATVQPARSRLGALVREIVAELPARCRTLRAGGHLIQLRGHAAVVDGAVRELAPAPMAVMAELAYRPGVVVSRSDLLAVLPGGGSDEHAVEMAVTRLRGAVGARVVQTVVKRGYRLAYEPESGAKYGVDGR